MVLILSTFFSSVYSPVLDTDAFAFTSPVYEYYGNKKTSQRAGCNPASVEKSFGIPIYKSGDTIPKLFEKLVDIKLSNVYPSVYLSYSV